MGYKTDIEKSKAFLCTITEISETEIREKIPFDIVTRKIKYLGGKRPVLRKLYNTEERN